MGDKCSDLKGRTLQTFNGHSFNGWSEAYSKMSEQDYRQCQAEKALTEPMGRPLAASSDQPPPKAFSLPNLEISEDKKN